MLFINLLNPAVLFLLKTDVANLVNIVVVFILKHDVLILLNCVLSKGYDLGFQLTDVQAYEDNEKGSSAYAMYENGENHIYLSIADGADAGAEKVRENMISYLEIKKDVQPGDKTTIVEYKGWQSFFDESMFESDKMTAIHYLEGNRYNVVAQGTGVTLAEMKSFLDKLSL